MLLSDLELSLFFDFLSNEKVTDFLMSGKCPLLVSNKILERVQNLERHLNGENEINETNNKAVVDEYMNIILDKPVFHKNKKLKKMVFSDI